MATSLALDTVRREGGELVLSAAGEIDLSNIDGFARALTTAVAEATAATVTVDLSAVEYLDSSAINALFAHAEQIRVIAPPHLMRVFTISGLTELTAIEAAAH